MIYGLKGIVKEISDATITLDTGVLSFGLQVPQPGSFHIGQQIELLTHMHWNQENGPALFGFGLPLEKSVFLLITSCSGVGPKLGMAILAQLGAASFLEAVQSGNESALSAVRRYRKQKS